MPIHSREGLDTSLPRFLHLLPHRRCRTEILSQVLRDTLVQRPRQWRPRKFFPLYVNLTDFCLLNLMNTQPKYVNFKQANVAAMRGKLFQFDEALRLEIVRQRALTFFSVMSPD